MRKKMRFTPLTKAVFAVGSFVRGQAFGIAVLLCAAAALIFPEAFLSWGGVKLTSLVVPAIQMIMFGMGTTLAPADFVRVVKRPWAVGIGVGLQFLIMPLVGLALAKICGFPPELAAGCVLVGSVAGGTASNVIAFLAKADVALSVTMTCCSTLLSPFITPVAMKVLAGCFIEIDVLKMMVEILKVVVVPIAAGAVVHYIFRRQFARHKSVCDRALSILSMTGICFTIIAITAPCRSVLSSAGPLLVAAAIAHNVTGYVGGYWVTRLTRRFTHLGETEARTVAIEVGMQNSGLASALAVGLLGSAVTALPANIFSIWMDFSGSLIANWWGRHPVTDDSDRASSRS